MDRKSFFKKVFIGATGTLIGGKVMADVISTNSNAPFVNTGKQIGLQMYSLRDELSTNVPETLKKISKMGYSYLETASYADGKVYGYAPLEFKKMVEDLGMKVTGAHVGKQYSKDDEKAVMDWWKKCFETQKTVGCKTTVMPSFPIGEKLSDIKVYCDYFNRVGELATKYNLQFGFHNHDKEFKTIEGEIIYDYMLKNTDPKKVMFEMDVYWVTKGGKNPIDYLNKYAGRFHVLHIKDESIIGESGTIDFEGIFKAAYAQGMHSYYVEVERYTMPADICVQRSCDTLTVAHYVK